MFLINLPIVVVAFWFGMRWITPSREIEPHPIDWASVALLLIGVSGLVVSIVEAWAVGLAVIAPLAVGIAALGLFARREQGSDRPLIDFRLLRDGMVATSLTALFGIQFAVFGLTVPLPLYLQHGLSASALSVGLVIALAGLGTPLLSLPIGRVTDRRGPRLLVLAGLALSTVGLVCVGLLAPLGGIAVLIPGLAIFAVSRPMTFTPASAGPFLSLGGEHRAFVSSLATESRQLGAVFGVALTTAALAAAHGKDLVDGDRTLVDGFRAATSVAAAVTFVAALLVWRYLPARRR